MHTHLLDTCACIKHKRIDTRREQTNRDRKREKEREREREREEERERKREREREREKEKRERGTEAKEGAKTDITIADSVAGKSPVQKETTFTI
jgi:hypothetical protein